MYGEVHELTADLAETRAWLTKQQERIQELETRNHHRERPKTDIRRLVALVAEHFNAEEIDDLAFRIGAAPDDIIGKSRRARARELVLYCERMVILPELLDACMELRPNVEWMR